ncbi:MAG: helix-turn-helix domain-containing protein [Candidatus Hydrogenedentes bacterium]|nr:helix-turn-helix domain-containing protein [Candidatus Hydrogenedentota bacterium]
MDLENMLTVEDVAQILHVKPLTVRQMFRHKRLRGFKLGKSWRTTREMLQEDIETVARGQAAEEPQARRRKKKQQPAAAPAAEPAVEGVPAETPPPKKEAKQTPPKAQGPAPDDTQQLLF